MKVKYNKDERKAEIEKLRKIFDKMEDKKVYCVLRNVSRSGMSRDIDFYIFIDNTKYYLSYTIAGLLDYPFNDNKGVKIGGAGMDMGFSVVYGLSSLLYAEEDRAGYKIRHEWI
jgi:hypothetical protein